MVENGRVSGADGIDSRSGDEWRDALEVTTDD